MDILKSDRDFVILKSRLGLQLTVMDFSNKGIIVTVEKSGREIARVTVRVNGKAHRVEVEGEHADI